MPHFEIVIDPNIFGRKTVVWISDIFIVNFGQIVLVKCEFSVKVSFVFKDVLLSFTNKELEFFHFF